MIFQVLFDSFLLIFQISEKLKSMGLESDSKISWRKGEGGEMFHQEINCMANSDNECNRQNECPYLK